jgi:hypothetical protein
VELPSRWKSVEAIRLPLFKRIPENHPLPRWRALESLAQTTHGSIRSDSVVADGTSNILAATGDITVDSLDLSRTRHYEVIAGGEIRLGSVLYSGPADLLLHSSTGKITVSAIPPDVLGNCPAAIPLRVRVESPRQNVFAGCNLERIPEIWTSREFLGEIESKSLIDSVNRR